MHIHELRDTIKKNRPMSHFSAAKQNVLSKIFLAMNKYQECCFYATYFIYNTPTKQDKKYHALQIRTAHCVL